jgi:hypothetical protein
MSKANLRIFTYFRDDGISAEKFLAFDLMIMQMKGKADAIAVTSPKALDDNYVEVMTNLEKLAEAELLLLIVPLAHRGPAPNVLN